MSHTTQPIPSTSVGVPGSVRWGIDHGRCFDVQGIWKYGHMVTDADSHQEAADLTLYKGPIYSTWVAPGTLLKVYRVGPKYDYMRNDERQFVVRDGRAEMIHTQYCGCEQCETFWRNGCVEEEVA